MTRDFWSEAQRLADAHGPQIGPDDSDFRDAILLDGDPVRNLETLRYIREDELIRDEFEHFLKLDDSELDLLATGTLPLIDALEEVTKAQIEGNQVLRKLAQSKALPSWLREVALAVANDVLVSEAQKTSVDAEERLIEAARLGKAACVEVAMDLGTEQSQKLVRLFARSHGIVAAFALKVQLGLEGASRYSRLIPVGFAAAERRVEIRTVELDAEVAPGSVAICFLNDPSIFGTSIFGDEHGLRLELRLDIPSDSVVRVEAKDGLVEVSNRPYREGISIVFPVIIGGEYFLDW